MSAESEPESRRHAGPDAPLRRLALAGLALEVVLAACFLWPFALWRYPTLLNPAQTLPEILGFDVAGAVKLALFILAAFAAYAVTVWYARGVHDRRGWWVVLGGVVLFSATLVPTNPAGAQDVFHNVSDARTLWLYGDNPATHPPAAHLEDPFVYYVQVWQEYPSSYGPLWYVVSGAPLPFTGAALWPSVIGQKVLTAAMLLGTTALVMAAVRRTRPGAEVLAGVIVGWNPLLLYDTAGNAHNDILMAGLGVAAYYAIVRRRWLLVFPLLALAVAVKWVLVLLGPLLLLWMLRQRDIPRRAIALSLLLGAITTAVLYVPYALTTDIPANLMRDGKIILSSPGSALTGLLITQRGADPGEAAAAARQVLTVAFFAIYAGLLWRLWRDASYESLATTTAWAILLFLVLVKWWFWPWYLIWLVPFAALTPHRWVVVAACVFSLTAALHYPIYYWRVFADWPSSQLQIAVVVFTAPILSALLPFLEWVARGVPRRRTPAPATVETRD